MSVSNINLSLVALKPTPPNTTLIDLISVSVVFAISASKATPNAIQLATPAVASSANTITVDAKAPNAVDLDPTADIQSTNKALFTRSEIAVGVAFDADIANTTDTDIKSIKVVINY
jgi:hypothetical protein